MVDSPNLGLPMLQASQAQKHVTVNEALVRLDGLAKLVLQSVEIVAPPVFANDGDCYGVPISASGDWVGHDGEIALYSNGGWVFVSPGLGWQGWVVDWSAVALFNGSNWVAGVSAMSENGATFVHEVIELDHSITTGAISTISAALPGGSIVYGVTGRVLTGMGGALTGWRLGVAGSDNRYGSGLGTASGAWMRGLTSSPLTYYSNEDLVLTSEGSDFVDGEVRLAVHIAVLGLPQL